MNGGVVDDLSTQMEQLIVSGMESRLWFCRKMREVGVHFTPEQRAQIEAAYDAGDSFGAQQTIIDRLLDILRVQGKRAGNETPEVEP